MKFGQLLESESVPEWSLHNIDYNALKEFIKVNTTRDQATAITIPGQTDTALQRFENDFYEELCRQHDRVGLFVATKADEINRRLQYLFNQVQRLLIRGTASSRKTTTLKRQRRFAKYEQSTLQLLDETRDLTRFVNAQVIAFRKILKKYKKWTGSGSLTYRFRDNVLSDPKSFTRRDFTQLDNHCDDLLATLRAATPLSSTPQTPREELSVPYLSDAPSDACQTTNGNGHVRSASSSTAQALSSSAGSTLPPPVSTVSSRPQSHRRSRHPKTPPPVVSTVQAHYWNEYDDGSEAGDVGPGGSGGYAIYLHPDDDNDDFPGMATLVSFFTVPLAKAKKWVAARASGASIGNTNGQSADRLLTSESGLTNYGTVAEAAAADGHALFDTDAAPVLRGHDGADDDSADDDDAFASDSDFPRGYEAHYASLPSINDQRMARYRDSMLLRGTIGCFGAALVLLGIASILISTGKHKLRVEVDTGVILGVVTSLGLACGALGMSMARHGQVRLIGRIAVWVAFATICALNGAVLVLVMGNTVI